MNVANQIQRDTKILLEQMGFQFLDAPTVQEVEGRFLIDVFIDEPKSLIGERGETLRSLQLVLRLMAAKKYKPEIKLDVDVNGYKKKRTEFIKELAYQARRQVLSRGREMRLEPMSSFDRRIIHTTLAAHNDVRTESSGEGSWRRVVVYPTNSAAFSKQSV
jgi:spoIIIJ-associated protein